MTFSDGTPKKGEEEGCLIDEALKEAVRVAGDEDSEALHTDAAFLRFLDCESVAARFVPPFGVVRHRAPDSHVHAPFRETLAQICKQHTAAQIGSVDVDDHKDARVG